MNDDVTARILIAVENGDALKDIGDTRAGLERITIARGKDLQAISKTTKAVEQQTAKELKLAALRERNERKMADLKNVKITRPVSESSGGSSQTINDPWALLGMNRDDYRKIQDERLKDLNRFKKDMDRITSERKAMAEAAAVAESAGLGNLSDALDKTGKAAGNAGKQMRGFSYSLTAARSAGRLLGINLGNVVNPAMIQTGIIAAGVASTFKLAGLAIKQYNEKLKYASDLAGQNSDSMRSVIERNRSQAESARGYMDALGVLNERERLSNVDKTEMNRLIDRLGRGYKNLSFLIDEYTGKIMNFDEANESFIVAQIDKKIADNKRMLGNLEESRRVAVEQIDKSIFTTYFLAKDVDRIGEEAGKLRVENAELKREREAANLNSEKAKDDKLKDIVKEHKHQIKLSNQQYEIQQLIANGLDRQAKKLEILNRLKKEGQKYEGTGKYETEYNSHIKSRLDAEMKLYDSGRQNKAKAELRDMELRAGIQEKINAGKEREAKGMEVTAKFIGRIKSGWSIVQAVSASALEMGQYDKGVEKSVGDELRAMENQIQVQRKLNDGKIGEANWLKTELSLREKIKGITDDQIKAYRKQWGDLGIEEHKERLHQLTKELEIQNLINSGKKDEARRLQWENEIRKQGRDLTPKQLKAEIDAREELYKMQQKEKADQFRFSFGQVAGEMIKYRNTSQDAIKATSLEAVRLQSRMMINNGGAGANNPQKEVANNTKGIVPALNSLSQLSRDLLTELRNLKLATV